MSTLHVPPEPDTCRRRERRRTWLRATLAGLGSTLLTACGVAPVLVQQPSDQELRALALRRVGFTPTEAGWEFSLTGKFLFDHDSAELDAESQAVADRLGRELAILGIRSLRVEGHTDNVGSDSYNLALSLRRAQAVQRALAAAGLHGAVIEIQGLGRAAQLTANRTAEERLQNRRVAVIVPAQ